MVDDIIDCPFREHCASAGDKCLGCIHNRKNSEDHYEPAHFFIKCPDNFSSLR